MPEYMLLMYNDAQDHSMADDPALWSSYLCILRHSGQFDGGSAMGNGVCFNRNSAQQAAALHITGFIRIRAPNLQAAQQWLTDNPVYKAGGSVEIHELLQD